MAKPVQRAADGFGILRVAVFRATVKAGPESAIANAENNHQLDVDRLIVAGGDVGKNMVMKRWRGPRARPRRPYSESRFAEITIVVREQEEA